MENFTLEKLLASVGARMRHDLAERLVAHPGEFGLGREEIIRDFLRRYLPKRFEVSSGFAFDCHGNVSKQLDVIIVDGAVAPHFRTAGGTRYFPCESIVSVGQVKSSVTSTEELDIAIENVESAKRLDRSCDGWAIDVGSGNQIDHQSNHLDQIFTFIMVVGKSLCGGTAVDHFLNYVLNSPAHVWPNVILSLESYLITFHCDEGVCPNPMHARAIAIQEATPDKDLLMSFYLLLGRAIDVTKVGRMPYWAYLNSAHLWNAKTHYSTLDNPPPYLSSLTSGR